MPARSLPARPSLAQFDAEAADLRRAHGEGRLSAAARIATHHPRMKGRAPSTVLETPIAAGAAQLVIAREYGFETWAALKHHVALGVRIAEVRPHPKFAEALAALDAGDLTRLEALLQSDPALVHARTNLDPPYHYFTGATLLHHVAGNPFRAPLPSNIAAVTRLLLDHGADVHACTLGPNGGPTLGLVITSRQASDAGVAGPLIDLLLGRGAVLDMSRPDRMVADARGEILDLPLANHAPRAAEKLIELGVAPDVCAAAALGRMEALRACFDEECRLRAQSRRRGASDRDAVGLAMLFAYVNKQPEAVDFLLELDGNWNAVGVNNGTALHRAAFDGDLAMVQRLVAKGADTSDRNNPFVATPLAWASHNHQAVVFEWMREHCAVDLHDAVSFDLRGHVEARLREDPAAVNARIDHWDIPQGTPLQWAARLGREALTALFLDRGADPNAVAGSGLTALDLVDEAAAPRIASWLKQRGARRAADL